MIPAMASFKKSRKDQTTVVEVESPSTIVVTMDTDTANNQEDQAVKSFFPTSTMMVHNNNNDKEQNLPVEIEIRILAYLP